MAQSRIHRLRTEHLETPYGIDSRAPRLSWNLAPTTAGVRGLAQTAYQILVARSAATLAQDQGDLWDSGRVESDKSILIPYAGKSLKSRDECFWKVRIWDQVGNVSSWSAPGRWTMGILRPEEWKANWIGLEGEEVGTDLPVALNDANWIWHPEGKATESVPNGTRYFRRVFDVLEGRSVARAQCLIAADNRCSVFLNGVRLGGHDSFRTVRELPVSSEIRPGTNVLGIEAINEGIEPNPAGVLCALIIEFNDGSKMIVATDSQWQSSEREEPGWHSDAKHVGEWKEVAVAGAVGVEPWGEMQLRGDRRLPARYVRKEIDVDQPVRRATVSFSGLGLAELYLNGEKVGDEVLSPGLTEYSKRALYVTHDVTKQIREGDNAVGMILGNGRFYAARSEADAQMLNYGFPRLLLNLHIEYADGSQQEIVSDGTWKITDDGPITANNEFDGEEYDARKELVNWSQPGFDDSNWLATEEVEMPPVKLSASMIEPIRVVEPVRPVQISEPSQGRFVFDFGQNIVGWCRLKVQGPAGKEVALRFAETLNDDGTINVKNLRGAKATDVYILKGEGTEVWEPRFTYHGFRYVEVTGLPKSPTLDTLTGRVVHDDLDPVGQFICSNQLLNQIFNNVVWGVRGNYRSIPTDCPQRDERLGWLGDRSEVSQGESYLFDIASLYSKWLRDIRDSQQSTGSIPDLCPANLPLYSDNVTWPSTAIIVPAMLLRQYGDDKVVADQYDSSAKWIDYMLGFVKGGLIDCDSYGDWCVPPEDPNLIHSKDPARITDKSLLATAMLYHDLFLMQKFAATLGKEEDSRRYAAKAQELSSAFNRRFFKIDANQYDNGTQTSSILPLRFGLVPTENRQEVFQHLVDSIEKNSNSHVGTGVLGVKYLNRVLSDGGRADIAYAIASQKDYPSWGYMISQGATTIWELWNGNTADPAMNSHNHVMLIGDLVVWFFEYLAGIAPDEAHPGFKHIVMQPHPVGDLSFARASFLSPYGTVRSEWQRNASTFDWSVLVPPNTTATVYVPTRDAATVREGGQAADSAAGVRFVKMEDGRAIYDVVSGSYKFQSELPTGAP